MFFIYVDVTISTVPYRSTFTHMRGSRNFCQGWGGGVQARLPGNSSDNVFLCFFFVVLNLFYNLQWFINGLFQFIIFQGFRGGKTFPRGGGPIFTGGGGLNAYLYRNP